MNSSASGCFVELAEGSEVIHSRAPASLEQVQAEGPRFFVYVGFFSYHSDNGYLPSLSFLVFVLSLCGKKLFRFVHVFQFARDATPTRPTRSTFLFSFIFCPFCLSPQRLFKILLFAYLSVSALHILPSFFFKELMKTNEQEENTETGWSTQIKRSRLSLSSPDSAWKGDAS